MKKLVMFGAGNQGQSYALNPAIEGDIIAFADNDSTRWGDSLCGKPVLSPQELKNVDFDYIVIAVYSSNQKEEIKNQLLELFIPEEKILTTASCPRVVVWGTGEIEKSFLTFPLFECTVDMIVDDKEKMAEKHYHGIPVISPEELVRIPYIGSVIVAVDEKDYKNIKHRIIEMNIDECRIRYIGDFMKYHSASARFLFIKDFAHWVNLQQLEGNVAECGVCTGDSAKFLNEYFPDRLLYLFDTFEGFAEEDVQAERKLSNTAFLNGEFNQVGRFSYASIETVMRKMSVPEKIVIKKGYFPESAENVEDRFCFVNLDMDLYKPMLAALHFFWDRLTEGGCILLHDYFHPELPGVAQAVADFEREKNIRLHKSPIGDECSIAVFK